MKKNHLIAAVALIILVLAISWGYRQQAKEQGLKNATKAFFILWDYAEDRQSYYLTPGYAFSETRKTLDKAKGSGVDISDLEERLPLLKTKAWRLYAEKSLSDLRAYVEGKPSGYFTASSVLREIEHTLSKAKEVGANVSDLEAQLPALRVKAWRLYAEKSLSDLQRYAEGRSSGYFSADSIIRDTRDTLEKAADIGVNVSDLKVRLPGLEKKAKEKSSQNKIPL